MRDKRQTRYQPKGENAERTNLLHTQAYEQKLGEYGRVAEWSNAADSKSVIGIFSIGGSNPPPSAKVNKPSK